MMNKKTVFGLRLCACSLVLIAQVASDGNSSVVIEGNPYDPIQYIMHQFREYPIVCLGELKPKEEEK